MVQYLSGYETTQKESLLDVMTVRSQAETPLLRTLPQAPMVNRITEYPIDEPFKSSDGIHNPGAPHEYSRKEGADFSYITPAYPTRLRAIAEIVHFAFEMSDTNKVAVDAAGMNSTWDYRTSQLFARFMNYCENLLMYGTGSPVTDGSTDDERRLQGLISWAGHTGIERVHGAGTEPAITDPYGVSIPSDFWSVFFDAQGNNLTRTLLYDKVLTTFLRAGGILDGVVFHAGFRLMGRIANFLMDPSGQPVNDRTIGAAEGGGYDFINWIKVPSGQVIGFRTNRHLDKKGSTYTIDPAGTLYTPGAPASPGGVTAHTMQADQTLIGYEPGAVQVMWLRPPHFKTVETAGDYSRLAVVGELSLKVKHPLTVLGCGNCIG